MNWVRKPLSALPTEWLAVLEEYNANFKARWDGLMTARADAETLRDRKRVEQIDSEIAQMMAAVNTGDIGDREIVGRITGGPNGFAILRQDVVEGSRINLPL